MLTRLYNSEFGFVTMVDSWYGWKNRRFVSFYTRTGQYVALPMDEVEVFTV